MTHAPRLDLTAAVAAPPAPDRAELASLQYCRQVCRQHARNFYYGMKLTPEPRRGALYAIYAFMRACDDLADDPVRRDQPPVENTDASALDPQLKRRLDRIEQFRQQMQQVLDGGALPQTGLPPARDIWPAFRYVVRGFPLQHDHLHAMLDGQRRDLTETRVLNFKQLYDYCYQVASVVGLVCVSVWGHDGDERIPQMAEHRGIAFQLTNILRDLREDGQRGRIYLPQDELRKFDVDLNRVLRDGPDARYDRLMQFQIERALSYYQRSAELENHIAPACQSTCWAMTRIYRGLLERIADEPRRVLVERVRLSSWRKTAIALGARFRGAHASRPESR